MLAHAVSVQRSEHRVGNGSGVESAPLTMPWERSCPYRHSPYQPSPHHSPAPIAPPSPKFPYSPATFPHSRAASPDAQASFPHPRAAFSHARSVCPHARCVFPHARARVPHSQATFPHSRALVRMRGQPFRILRRFCSALSLSTLHPRCRSPSSLSISGPCVGPSKRSRPLASRVSGAGAGLQASTHPPSWQDGRRGCGFAVAAVAGPAHATTPPCWRAAARGHREHEGCDLQRLCGRRQLLQQ
jgi:hypothetical protein